MYPVAPVRRINEGSGFIASLVVNFLASRQLALLGFSVLAKLPSISDIAERIAIQFDPPKTARPRSLGNMRSKILCPAVRSICVNAGHRTRALILASNMNRNIFYIIGVIVVIVIVLKVLHVF